MSTYFMNYVLHLCDRLFDKRSPDSIQRAGQLSQMLVLVVVFHLITGVSFLKMQEYELKHPRIIRDVVDISFVAPEVVPPHEIQVDKMDKVPQAFNLNDGKTTDTGSADQQKAHADKLSVPVPKAQESERPLVSDPVETKLSRQIAEAPVSLTSMSPIKSDPIAQSKSQKFNSTTSDLVGTSSNQPASGNPGGGGSTELTQGNGKGGVGVGGDGVKDGDYGPGEGIDQINGSEQPRISTEISEKRAMAPIGNYKRALAKKLTDAWQPGRKGVSLTVNLLIAKDGTLLSTEIVASSGNKRIDRDAMETIQALEFEPLPDWFRGRDLLFQFDLKSV